MTVRPSGEELVCVGELLVSLLLSNTQLNPFCALNVREDTRLSKEFLSHSVNPEATLSALSSFWRSPLHATRFFPDFYFL